MRCAGLLFVVGVGVGVFTMSANAGSESYYIYADVVDVEPLVERYTVTEPQQACSATNGSTAYSHSRHRHYGRANDHSYDYHQSYDNDREYAHAGSSHSSGAATLLGGVIGGLVGSQFGGGNGKKVLGIAGAIVGASVANQAARHRHDNYGSRGYYNSPNRNAHYRPQRCATVMESREIEEVTGYRVRYLYQGQEFVKRVDTDPGDRVRVQVQVTPVADGPAW
jgi:uncharacterized protein YcfJ